MKYDAIDAVETRLEAYRSVGSVNINRIYALRLKSGELIILGEDRALNTSMESATVTSTVKRILQQGSLDVRDLGMAEGRGGLFAVLFTAPPPWDAPSLSDEQQAILWRKAGITGQLAQNASFETLFKSR